MAAQAAPSREPAPAVAPTTGAVPAGPSITIDAVGDVSLAREVVDRMQANGWVVRERDPADRRRYVVRVTDEGRTFLDRYNAVARRAGDRMMAGLDDAQRSAFTATAVHMLREAGVDVTRLARAAKLG